MTHKHTNSLINETSPYLLQHAHNPVDWMPWGEAAWSKAKTEDKLVIVSIGYSACHWCHVMEHESFEEEVVAKIMNDNFISIKVDREERPDVDQIYMDAVQIITGHGGWPLNAICLPDGRPIYAGTYFKREDWKQVLLYMHSYFQQNRDEVMETAAEITRGIKVMDNIPLIKDISFDATDREMMFAKIDQTWDYQLGGRRGAPKFPMPVTMMYLLQNYYYTKNSKALSAVTITLDNMMAGGIYDHVGGGFARYSVDETWTIPHFEKMLYDNAQLVSLYSKAYQITKDKSYKDVVYETLAFVEREMTDASGGFYSALDADSEGMEGKYYVWKYEELKEILGADFEEFCQYYDVTESGNFEHGWINLRSKSQESRTENLQSTRPDSQLTTQNRQLLNLLLSERSKRIRPGLDDKMLTSWNALMIKTYADAYKAFGVEMFLTAALRTADFILKNSIKADGSIYRSHKAERSAINGFLDDYSFTIEAFIALYEHTQDEQWLYHARALADQAIQNFYSTEQGVFFYTSIADDPLIARKSETADNVIPSSNSSMAKGLILLGHYFESDHYLSIARQMVMNMKDHTLKHTAFYANWAIAMDSFLNEPYEVAIVGPDAVAVKREFDQHYFPDCIWSVTATASEMPLLKDKVITDTTLIYVCRNRTCGLPVKTVAEAMQQLSQA
jgi:uncharacterized protein YyaL (SSP411 family)